MGSLIATRGTRSSPSPDQAASALLASPHRGTHVSTAVSGVVTLAVSRRDDDATALLGREGEWVAAIHGSFDNADAVAAMLPPESRRTAATAPEILIAAFRAWGAKALDRIRGGFTGVVSDGDTLWCFRDHIGSRPLFYRLHSGTAIFATEVKQVVAAAGIPRQPNMTAVERVFFHGIGPETAIQGVERVPYSTLVEVRDGTATQSRYWDPSDLIESAVLSLDEAAEQLVEILGVVIPRHLSGRDTVALSGGIDSPTVAAFAAPDHLERWGRPLAAYSAVYPDHASVDESRYTRAVAEHLSIPLTTYEPRRRPLDDLDRWVDLADGPWDSLPAAIVIEGYEVARSTGANTVLTGDLAEYLMTLRTGFLGHLLLRGRWQSLADQLAKRRNAGRSRASLTRQIARDVMPAPLGRLYSKAVGRYSTFVPPWITGSHGGPAYRSDMSGSMRRRWIDRQLAATKGTTTTTEVDEIFADFTGVSVRRPLADRDLWEFFLSLPAEIKLPSPQPKSLARMALRGRLPNVILDRTDKTVFDEEMLDRASYDGLKRWIDDSHFRMPNVDYPMLLKHLERRDLPPVHLVWAYDLARAHAFMSLFR